MKRTVALLLLSLLAPLALAACGEDETTAEAPPPAPMTREAVGHYCNMILLDHPGPKGQIFVRDRAEPYWFSSVHDTVAFTMLPEEPKDIRAIYVTDMSRAASWENPGSESWVRAEEARYVIDSKMRGGMGQAEAVPFTEPAAAQAFAAQHGGRVVAFQEIPREYILGPDAAPPTDKPASHAHPTPTR